MNKKWKWISLVSLVFVLGACQTTTNDRKNTEEIKTENSAEATSSSMTTAVAENKTTYPLTVTTYGSDGLELEVVFEKAPEKVLAVYQGSIETMLALGLQDRLVAAAGLDNEVPDEQKAAFSTVKYLDSFTPTLEETTALAPDMIFSWGSLFADKTLGDAKGWVDKGAGIYINTNTRRKTGETSYPRTLENEYTDILTIGKIFDVQSKAEAIVNDMKDTITTVLEKTKDMEKKPNVLVVEPLKDTLSNYGEKTLGGDMVVKLGATLTNPEGSTLGKEDIINANPEVIFVVYMPYEGDNAEEVKQKQLDVILKDDAFASLDAVKNNRVVPIMLSEMYASATRTKDGIVSFAKGLYPNLVLE